MTERTCLSIILAAGQGTRMKSALPKVLHRIGSLPMVSHAIATARAAGTTRLAAVIGPNAEPVRAAILKTAPEAAVHEQIERRGTAHAVLAAAPSLTDPIDDVLILYGDTPLVRPETLVRVRDRLESDADVVVLGFRATDPTGYGRLIEKHGALLAIREHRDASVAERTITFCNSGLIGVRGSLLLDLLHQVGNANAKGEFYLTDIVEIAHARGHHTVAIEGDETEFLGVNDRPQLAACEAVFQARARARLLESGVTMIAPDTVTLAHDTRIAADVVIEPHVVVAEGVTIESGATIRAFSHLEGAHIEAGAVVGPYARLRPGARIGACAHIGNFVEIKASNIQAGAKVNHLSYIGDAEVGEKTNIGAGTITCNYDGYGKYRTTIGAGAFIGSNSSLVAPVTIGAGAYVASGSVITQDVPPDALAVARGRQSEKPGWAIAFRARMAKPSRA